MSLAPVAFISHGAPTFAIEPGKLGARLRALSTRLDEVSAVLVVSPHWQTHEFRVGTHLAPPTLHDFSGFPPELYQLTYPVSGHPAYAMAAKRLLEAAGFPVMADPDRGLDHGVWVPLHHLRAAADKPVFQVSMPWQLDPATALQMGRALAPLREQGVMLIGSGSLTHNLGSLRSPGAPTAEYVEAFSAWVRQTVADRDLARLADYRALAPHARLAHPSDEHLLPLLVAMGAVTADDRLTVFDGDIRYGALSMESYGWGLSE